MKLYELAISSIYRYQNTSIIQTNLKFFKTPLSSQFTFEFLMVP